MNVLFAYADTAQEWNTSQWRCVMPARAISAVPGWSGAVISLMELLQNPDTDKMVAWADIIIVERLLVMEVLQKIEEWKARGKWVLGSLDDAYQYMPKTIASYPFWHEGRVDRNGKVLQMEFPPVEQLTWGVKLVDGLLLASKQLVEDWKKYTPYAYWFPNFMDTWTYIQARAERVNSPYIRIGWGGSFTHVESWKNSGILPALQEVFKARENVKMLIAGGDTRILDLIPVPPERKRLVPWVGYEKWPGILANFDIGLIPLAGAYDTRRSWIKAIEYMVMGVPWIGSDNSALGEVTDMGVIVSNSPTNWRRCLIHVIDHLADYRERALERANQYPRVDVQDQGRMLVRILERALQNCERKPL